MNIWYLLTESLSIDLPASPTKKYDFGTLLPVFSDCNL